MMLKYPIRPHLDVMKHEIQRNTCNKTFNAHKGRTHHQLKSPKCQVQRKPTRIQQLCPNDECAQLFQNEENLKISYQKLSSESFAEVL